MTALFYIYQYELSPLLKVLALGMSLFAQMECVCRIFIRVMAPTIVEIGQTKTHNIVSMVSISTYRILRTLIEIAKNVNRKLSTVYLYVYLD